MGSGSLSIHGSTPTQRRHRGAHSPLIGSMAAIAQSRYNETTTDPPGKSRDTAGQSPPLSELSLRPSETADERRSVPKSLLTPRSRSSPRPGGRRSKPASAPPAPFVSTDTDSIAR